MKKYISLTTITAALIALLLFLPGLLLSFVPVVSAAQMAQTTFTNVVTATGTVEEKEKSEVVLDVPVVPGEVNVAVGDSVKVGDVLATIDKEQTVEAIANTQSSLSDASGLPDEYASLMTGGSFTKKLNNMPDEIISTVAGVVTSVSLQQGSMSMSGSSVVTVSDLTNLQARVSVNENAISNIALGQTATITGSGFGENEYVGVVSQIYPTAKRQLNGMSTETVVDIVLDIQDTDTVILSGFSVTAEIETGESCNVFVLPYECVAQDDENNEFVYVYKNGKAVKTIVETGIETDSGVEIKSGITDHDYVVYPASKLTKDNEYIRFKRQ